MREFSFTKEDNQRYSLKKFNFPGSHMSKKIQVVKSSKILGKDGNILVDRLYNGGRGWSPYHGCIDEYSLSKRD